MINSHKLRYIILGKSEILEGKFVPTLHGSFSSYAEAFTFASARMRETPFKVEIERASK